MTVAVDELSGTEQAVLLVLMSEARPVPNPELERLGPKLDRASRERLNRLNLVDTASGRPLVHELTDEGWAVCRSMFGAEVPARASGQGRALYTVLRALGRYFDSADLRPADVFLPQDPAPADTVEARIRDSYGRLAHRPGGWVTLTRLREDLPDVERDALDVALVRMYQIAGVSLIPEENQKTLTPADRDAAIRIGNQHKHLIAIEP
ncbi:hypothetical protein [Mycolicibacterium litorale]|uniref:Uncharacterized protein n=1 Tax=Mycolicibacterium litorale TaxID=758802 RepID=A0AAD1MU36_9MYCO|nr:hypothetical protein [Mycolicibacterium litorale]MCV7414792.1 hypothetical protein [Mycolicibacterium litorale]TDY08037.1 hypothetical protein BCL50_0098 [Mycolicibacterium litorale]BBY15957.1 hypothetical protein MLIT_15490 [Mycolicibacterium litorale]